MKRQILVNIREKSNIFWTLLFPLILATSFILPWEGLWEDMPWKMSRQLLSQIRVQILRKRKPFWNI